jgi:hypothetical protein
VLAEALFWGLLAHFVGDYLLQSDWMAVEKIKRWLPAIAHAVWYSVPFGVVLAVFWPGLGRYWLALVVIGGTHAVIDRYRLARHVGWAKNQMAPKAWRHPWNSHVSGTGYHISGQYRSERCSGQAKPVWMSVWLMIITDNTLHVLINSAVLALAVGGR